mmetsp:Transcript_8095/g.12467  ORF Transcript_8095/g.12467 Transcript_8095/m.12467 type:complete len:84 (+) Transcript_8095:1714-1965(+)
MKFLFRFIEGSHIASKQASSPSWLRFTLFSLVNEVPVRRDGTNLLHHGPGNMVMEEVIEDLVRESHSAVIRQDCKPGCVHVEY